MAATSNLAPRSFSRSAMKSCGTLSPMKPNASVTVFWKNGRSAHMPSAQGIPALPAGKQRRRRIAPLQFADDDLGVAIDVGTDLHRWRAAVAAGHRHQVRPRHDPGNPHRVPGELLEPEDERGSSRRTATDRNDAGSASAATWRFSRDRRDLARALSHSLTRFRPIATDFSRAKARRRVRQNASAHGRRSSSSVQALRCW